MSDADPDPDAEMPAEEFDEAVIEFLREKGYPKVADQERIREGPYTPSAVAEAEQMPPTRRNAQHIAFALCHLASTWGVIPRERVTLFGTEDAHEGEDSA